MESSPVSSPRGKLAATDQENGDGSGHQGKKIKKPPPITPRRFTRFFTPRPRNAAAATVKTSRAALRAISASALNTRNVRAKSQKLPGPTGDDTTFVRGKKRKLSFVLADDLSQTSPVSAITYLGSQEIRSSPTIPERRSPLSNAHLYAESCDTEDETEIESEEEEEPSDPQERILPYRSKTISGGILSARLTGRRIRKEPGHSGQWQHETGHFYSLPNDINNTYSHPSAALPFSVAACHTNPLVAVGDEEGRIRLLDPTADYEPGLTTNWLTMRPHDNALMDLEFSSDDTLLATACGDQTCQIIDPQAQKSLYTLGDHRCSVKQIAFQPGSNGHVLASCGRDGQINFWDLRCNNTPRANFARRPSPNLPMHDAMRQVYSTHSIRDAHVAGPRATKFTGVQKKHNMVPGRQDFSVTSLSFLGDSKPHLLVTASEIDTTIKVWDIRTSVGTSRRAPNPLSVTAEPRSHAHHRSFGVTSLVLNTDGSRLYALARDHTVYAYATSHLVLGSSRQMSPKSKPSKASEHNEGLQPLYGFRHPSLLVQTFWPRLALRKATDSTTELLAVGSSDDCTVLFPTNERYLIDSAKEIPALHQMSKQATSMQQQSRCRPSLSRNNSSFTNRLLASTDSDQDQLPIYQHGTPLIRGHDKEVTSVAWTSEGTLITASDDYTVRCWREDREIAKELRQSGENNGARWKKGWSSVGLEGFDDDDF